MENSSSNSSSSNKRRENRPILSLRDVTFSYNGSGDVLNGFSLDIPTGSATAILGPNGSGKTTLIRLILGLLSPASGEIELDGKSYSRLSRNVLSRSMGLVPQDESVSFDFTVLEYVLMGRAPYLGLLSRPGEEDIAVADKSLRETGLEKLRLRALPSLSGGEKQLATVARALTQQPRILLLDEPTSHLDLGNKSHVLRLLRSLSDGGVTTIFTTHDPNSAAAIADHVVLMKQFRPLALGPTSQVLTEQNLSETFGVRVEVLRLGDRIVVLTP